MHAIARMFLGVMVLCATGQFADAADINAASCDRDDVATAVTTAVDGDRVIIPAGTCTWTTQGITITDKILTILGQGVGQTVIVDSLPITGPFGDQVLFWWSTKPGGISRISGIEFREVRPGFPTVADMIHIFGTSDQFRFDHNKCTPIRTTCVEVFGYVRGVADHNTFDVSSFRDGIEIKHNTWDAPGTDYGDKSWASDSTMGTSQAFFIEDNVFTNDQSVTFQVYATDDWMGSRAVHRFNQYINTNWSIHGTDTAGRWRSARHSELYNNTFTMNLLGNSFSSFAGFRGGTGVAFNNVFTATNGTMDRAIDLGYLRVADHTRFYDPWGYCGTNTITSLTSSGTTATATTASNHGLRTAVTYNVVIAGASPSGYNGTFIVQSVPTLTTFTYTLTGSLSSPATGTITMNMPWDGNTDATGYRCIEQGGAGKTDLISGFTPTPVGPIHPASEPIYAWNNLFCSTSGTSCTPTPVLHLVSAAPTVIIEDRDFFSTTVKPGYVSYTYPHPLVGSAPPPSESPGPAANVPSRRRR